MSSSIIVKIFLIFEVFEPSDMLIKRILIKKRCIKILQGLHGAAENIFQKKLKSSLLRTNHPLPNT